MVLSLQEHKHILCSQSPGRCCRSHPTHCHQIAPSHWHWAAPIYNQRSAPCHCHWSARSHCHWAAPSHWHWAAPVYNQWAAPNLCAQALPHHLQTPRRPAGLHHSLHHNAAHLPSPPCSSSSSFLQKPQGCNTLTGVQCFGHSKTKSAHVTHCYSLGFVSSIWQMWHHDEGMGSGLESRDSFGSIQIQHRLHEVNKLKSILLFSQGYEFIHLDLEAGFSLDRETCNVGFTSQKRETPTSTRSSSDFNTESLTFWSPSAPMHAAYSSGVWGDQNCNVGHFLKNLARWCFGVLFN